MDLEAILKQLREELVHVNASILVIEQIASGKARGRGRPPKWLAEVKAVLPKRRGRPPGSGKKMAAAQGE